MSTFAPYMSALREVVGEASLPLAVRHLALAREELSEARIRALEEASSAPKQRELLDSWFGHFVHDAVKNLIIALVKDRALALLDALPGTKPGTKARVTSARPLDAEAAEKVRAAIGGMAEGADITFAVDKELIGGVQIKIGDRLIDASVRRTLAALAR